MIHGSRTAYCYHRCRCDECRAANAAYVSQWAWTTGRASPREQSGHKGSRSGRLLVTCWCEASFVSIDRAEVLAGRTGSCGPDCSRIATESRSRHASETSDRTQSVA